MNHPTTPDILATISEALQYTSDFQLFRKYLKIFSTIFVAALWGIPFSDVISEACQYSTVFHVRKYFLNCPHKLCCRASEESRATRTLPTAL